MRGWRRPILAPRTRLEGWLLAASITLFRGGGDEPAQPEVSCIKQPTQFPRASLKAAREDEDVAPKYAGGTFIVLIVEHVLGRGSHRPLAPPRKKSPPMASQRSFRPSLPISARARSAIWGCSKGIPANADRCVGSQRAACQLRRRHRQL